MARKLAVPVIMARKQAVSGQIAVTTMLVVAAKG